MKRNESVRQWRAVIAAVACLFLVTQITSVEGDDYGNIAGAWKVSFGDGGGGAAEIRLESKTTLDVRVSIYDVDLSSDEDFYFVLKTADEKRAVAQQQVQRSEFVSMGTSNLAQWIGSVNVEGRRFGYTHLFATLLPVAAGKAEEYSRETLKVSVLRDEHLDDKIYSYSSAGLVLLMFINLGTALDLERFKSIILRPIGPFIGVCSRYALMPALGLGLGKLFFSDRREFQLALFFSALSPSGGLANICAVFLKGNINLSIAATTINSLLALGMLPLWIFVVGRVVFEDSSLSVPFVNLAVGSVALMLALTLGVLLRVFVPKTTKFIFKYLKPLSLILSLALIGLTVGINSFVFRELTGMVVLAAFVLSICGYLLSYLLSRVVCRTRTDSLTIAIETAVLNMTVPIILLQYSLEEPMVDMTMVVPITSSLMSILLVLIFYVVRRMFGCNVKTDPDAFDAKLLTDQHYIINE